LMNHPRSPDELVQRNDALHLCSAEMPTGRDI